ncbi:MAG: hypothetical protein LBF60_06495 [Treponema sp.]|nr:hypothetical protein [Treponema sp.]
MKSVVEERESKSILKTISKLNGIAGKSDEAITGEISGAGYASAQPPAKHTLRAEKFQKIRGFPKTNPNVVR